MAWNDLNNTQTNEWKMSDIKLNSSLLTIAPTKVQKQDESETGIKTSNKNVIRNLFTSSLQKT